MVPKNKHVTCTKCQKKVLTRDSLQCSLCKKIYDLKCAIMSEKLFDLMGRDSKAAWKCTMCRNKQSKHKITAGIAPKGTTRGTSTPSNSKTPYSPSGWVTPSSSRIPNDNTNTTLCSTDGKSIVDDESINLRETITTLSSENAYVTKRKPTSNCHSSLNLSGDTEFTHNTSFNSMPELSIREDNIKLQELELEISELKMKVLSADKEVEDLLIENCKLKQKIKDMEKKNRQYKNMYIETLSST